MKEQKVQATKRTIRLRRWKVEVLGETIEFPEKSEYVVIAAAPIDARIMAYALDGGFSDTPTAMSENDLPRIEKYTRILEVSSG